MQFQHPFHCMFLCSVTWAEQTRSHAGSSCCFQVAAQTSEDRNNVGGQMTKEDVYRGDEEEENICK